MNVTHGEQQAFLQNFGPHTIDHIVTSPPFVGLPGRADTYGLVRTILQSAKDSLTPLGTVTLIVGSAPGHKLLPYEIAHMVDEMSDGVLSLYALYIWDRTGILNRRVDRQTVNHDVILLIRRTDNQTYGPDLAEGSIIRTLQPGFNYGMGVTTPPDLAALLINRLTNPGDLVVDPLCGLGEIGVAALKQSRRFLGCDLNAACVEIANARMMEHQGRRIG